MIQRTWGIAAAALLLVFSCNVFAQRDLGARPTNTGGPLKAEQAAYDVKHYDITARVDPANKSIAGVVTITARIVSPIETFLLDLDTPFTVSAVAQVGAGNATTPLRFDRPEGQIRAWFPQMKQPGETVSVRVTYSGVPRVAPRPPWVGGFLWEKTADGSPYIAIACQNDGADLWIPIKDHPSDEADSVALHITVPQPLVVATIGRFQKVTKNSDGTQTYDWLMTNPVNNYEIVLNIAPYKTVEDSYKSVAGDTFPIIFYVLPEDLAKGPALVAQVKEFLKFFESYLGPYPFRSQKLGIAETPHLGMEHSTIIAYGNKFKNNDDGFDSLMFHEFGHEWWANLVTAADWKDFWIHEGFESFMDELYIEKLKGQDEYLKRMANRIARTRNMQPVAPPEPKIAYQVYMAEPDYLKSDGDIYGKGACILHTLRHLIGDEAFFRALRRMAYPRKEMEKWTDGRQTRFVTTDDFLTIAEQESGMKLDWFFELYLRQPKLPKLVTATNGNTMTVRWETPNNLPFPMPIDIEQGGKIRRLEMPGGTATVDLTAGEPHLDPKGWVLK
jgi:aminopeptidase N